MAREIKEHPFVIMYDFCTDCKVLIVLNEHYIHNIERVAWLKQQPHVKTTNTEIKLVKFVLCGKVDRHFKQIQPQFLTTHRLSRFFLVT